MCGALPDGECFQFIHEALFYGDETHAVGVVREFLEEGSSRDEPALVAVRGPLLERLRAHIRGSNGRVTLQEITPVGLNPGRILAWISDWLAAQPGRTRVVVQPLWPGREEAECMEVIRHEALVNLALRDAPVRVLCVFEDLAVDGETRAALEQTHPVLRRAGPSRRPSRSYTEPLDCLRRTEESLTDPERPIEEAPVTDDLHKLRQTIAASRITSALPEDRQAEFILAVNEAATNALKYDWPPRTVRLWRSGPYVVAEVEGRGEIDDPLAGRLPPPPAALEGRGLWMVNQLCDLVELRNCDSRATVRMHMRCA